MFVGRCVEYMIGFIGFHYLENTFTILDIRDDRDDFDRAYVQVAQFFIDQVDRIFTVSQQDQFFRSEFCDLAADFRSDRTTCATHQDHFIFQLLGNFGAIQLHFFTSQQIDHIDVAEAADGQFPFQDILDTWHLIDFHICLIAVIQNGFQLRRLQRWDGNRHLIDGKLLHQCRDVFFRTDHRDVEQARIRLVPVVVHNADDFDFTRLAQDAVDEDTATRTGPDNQRTDRLVDRHIVLFKLAIIPFMIEPPKHTRSGQEHQTEHVHQENVAEADTFDEK